MDTLDKTKASHKEIIDWIYEMQIKEGNHVCIYEFWFHFKVLIRALLKFAAFWRHNQSGWLGFPWINQQRDRSQLWSCPSDHDLFGAELPAHFGRRLESTRPFVHHSRNASVSNGRWKVRKIVVFLNLHWFRFSFSNVAFQFLSDGRWNEWHAIRVLCSQHLLFAQGLVRG